MEKIIKVANPKRFAFQANRHTKMWKLRKKGHLEVVYF